MNNYNDDENYIVKIEQKNNLHKISLYHLDSQNQKLDNEGLACMDYKYCVDQYLLMRSNFPIWDKDNWVPACC